MIWETQENAQLQFLFFSRTFSGNKVRRLEMETAVTFLENGDRWYNLRDWERVCEFGVNCSKRLRSINENSVVPFYMYLLHCVSFSSKFVKVDFSFSFFSFVFFKYFFILTPATITRRSLISTAKINLIKRILKILILLTSDSMI